MKDPIVELASDLRIIRLADDLLHQINSIPGGGVTVEILRRLKTAAAEALSSLPFYNLSDPSDVERAQGAQNMVKRYQEWFEEMSALIAEARALDQKITQDEREELLDLLTQSPEGQQRAIDEGLIDPDQPIG